VLDFTPTTEAALRPGITRDGMELIYHSPAPEFAVSVLPVDGHRRCHEIDAPARHHGPQILLCTEGSTVVHAKSNALTLEPKAAARMSANDGAIRLVAPCPTKLFRAPMGL
jgi:mannose-6-phosphate isomerase